MSPPYLVSPWRPPRRSDLDLPKGILDARSLPDGCFDSLWESLVIDKTIKDRLLVQAVLNFTLRPKIDRALSLSCFTSSPAVYRS